MRTNSQKYGGLQTMIIVSRLLRENRWFQVDPVPGELFEITVKEEVYLPEVLTAPCIYPLQNRGALNA